MQHILVCLSSAPSNARIIAAAARMAQTSSGRFTALFVETPDFAVATPENKQRLQDNCRLAERLGADVEKVLGDDIAYQIAEFARLSEVTTIVLGRSAVSKVRFFGKPTLTDQLVAYAPQVDIHIIPDQNADASYRPKQSRRDSVRHVLMDSAKSLAILICATLLGVLFDHVGFTDTNIIMVYILGVLLISAVTSRRMYSLIASVASVFIFNFLFTYPRFSFSAYETGYPVTFITMFLTAMITGTFAIRYKEQARQAARIARRTKILFDTGKTLSKANGKESILQVLADQIVKLLGRNIVIYDGTEGTLSSVQIHTSNLKEESQYDEEKERPAARWVYQNNRFAGATTEVFSELAYMYFALRVNDRVYGVVGVETRDNPLDAQEYDILLSILGEGALALENEKNAREKEIASVQAKNEQLRANILRTISHDLRTPLTTISGYASSLLSSDASFDEATRMQMYTDIYNDSQWLIKLVENLLAATRIEDGRMNLRMNKELLGEIVEAALEHVNQETNRITYDCQDEMLMVKADSRLLMQVIINLADNAIKYSPSGSPVCVSIKRDADMAVVEVSDYGCGIADEEKQRVFEKFYRGSRKNNAADNRRSLGLGLYLCDAIVAAHGGSISIKDNEPQGTVFSFSLPIEEVAIDESLSCFDC